MNSWLSTLLIWIVSGSLAAQTINVVTNLENELLIDMTFPEGLLVSYDYDTSTVWFRELGFDPDSLYRALPDSVNVLVNGICFLSVYQEGIEYVFIQAYEKNNTRANLRLLELLNANQSLGGWVLIRRSPPLFASVGLIRKLTKLYLE